MTGLLLYGATASAVPTIDFDLTMSSAGLLAYSGSVGLNGASLQVSSISASGTGRDGIFSCIDCFLTFETGDMTTGSTAGWLVADPSDAFLSLFGEIDLDGDGVGDVPLRMRGDFVGPQIAVTVPNGRTQAGIAGGLFLADYNAPFADSFGVSYVSVGGVMMHWGGSHGANGGGGLLRTIFQRVTAQQVAVPEPALTSILAGVLLAMAALGSRKGRR